MSVDTPFFGLKRKSTSKISERLPDTMGKKTFAGLIAGQELRFPCAAGQPEKKKFRQKKLYD